MIGRKYLQDHQSEHPLGENLNILGGIDVGKEAEVYLGVLSISEHLPTRCGV